MTRRGLHHHHDAALHQRRPGRHVLEQEGWDILVSSIAETERSRHHQSFRATPVQARIGRRSPSGARIEATLRHIREAVGEYNFAAQYQQNPTPLGGAIIRTAWAPYYEPGDRPERFIQTVQTGTPPTATS